MIPSTDPRAMTPAQCATLACLLEVSAPKPGNVHRGADFADMTLEDFAVSAVAIAPAIQDAADGKPVGRCILQAIRATRQAVGRNTNLGAVLLMVPLAAADLPLRRGVANVLSRLDQDDAQAVYEAIRTARPGGLGAVGQADVAGEPPSDLLDAMRLAADRDLVARQYANGFVEVLDEALPWLREELAAGLTLPEAIVRTQLRLLSRHGDSLIARKRGAAVARQASDMASEALACGRPGDEAYHRRLADFDFWLRADGNARNPGTTADLLAAALLAGLREDPGSILGQNRAAPP